MKFLLIALSFFLLSPSYAVKCEWWQTKYSASIVDKHPRQGTKGVGEHPRKEYCRDRWKDSSLYIKQFNDEPIPGWPIKAEIFKEWRREEIKLILEILPTLPSWTGVRNYNFRRAKFSIHKDNAATSELSGGAIIFYDQFFKEKSKKSVIVHESSHHLYKQLSPKEIADFLGLSGWTVEVAKDGKIYESAPKKLILPDSGTEKDEDFANHLQIYYQNPGSYKASYPKIYDFFMQRYPL